MAYKQIAYIDAEGYCSSTWAGDWPEGRELKENQIDVTSCPGVLGMRYVDGEWVEVPQPEPEPTEEELAQAEMLLMGTEILAKQSEQDEVLAEILLNQMEV